MASSVEVGSVYQERDFGNYERHSGGVSWGAVIGGAFAAAALSLILLALGTGIGLSAISPWTDTGASSAAVGRGAIVWLIIIQIIALSLGGYMAGRLRTKWDDVHTHEVFFRDTAHGFLVWAVGLVITVVFLASAAASMVGGAANSGMASARDSQMDPNGYFVDSMFRTDQANAGRVDPSMRSEVGLILARSLRDGDMSASDRSYLGQLVAARTGMSQADADARVSDVVAQARQAADTARKRTAHSLYWTFLALLIGAFCASFAATIGGRRRDLAVL
jgi:hypothetical protein